MAKKVSEKPAVTKPKRPRPKPVAIDELVHNSPKKTATKKTTKTKSKNSPKNPTTQSSAKKIRPFYWLWRWIVMPLLLIFVVFQLVVGAMLYVWRDGAVNGSMFMLTHRLMGGTVAQAWVDYDAIAKSAKQAAIASEDAKFATHSGFDLVGIENALKANEKSGEVSKGGSTISQQLAKNLFLTSHRSYVRKGEEAIITLMMEKMWDKQRILEVYLNVAEFGEGIYGVQAAAQHYFDKPASKLSREQAALLIAMLPNPKYYGKNLNNKRLRNKQKIILARMNSADLP